MCEKQPCCDTNRADGPRFESASKTAGPSPQADDQNKEHILTCLSASPSNAKVVKTAASLAAAYHASFTALFVETADTKEHDLENWARLTKNRKLAEHLGARIVTLYEGNIAMQIAEYARTSGVTKIVIGRSNNKKRWLSGEPALVEQLISLAPNLDIYIIPEIMPPFTKIQRKKITFTLADIAKTTGILCLTSLVGLWFFNLGFSEANIITVYILGVLLTALYTSQRLYGGIASLLSVIIFNFLFTEPRFTLHTYNPGYLITFSVMFIASFVTSTLTIRVKTQAMQSAQKAYRTEVLLETSQKLQRAKSKEEIFTQTAHQMIKLLGRSILFYPAAQNKLGDPVFYPKNDAESDAADYTTKAERMVAQWVYENNKHAGATTSTHSGAKCLYFSIRSQNTVFAVTAIAMDHTSELDAFEKNLLIAMFSECALALEKEQINDTKNSIAMKAQKERLRANLLRSVSHDLRTPLTSISGNVGILINNADLLTENKKQQLYHDISEDSIWLINLVENLLSVTRIDNGAMDINMQPELLDEVIQEALRHISRQNFDHTITVSLEDDLLMARMDSRLIIQVFVNLLDNALKYTPPFSHILIHAKRANHMVLVSIADDGEGIPDEKKEKLFEMYATLDNKGCDRRRGLGLGLFLCRAIITAHGGSIYVQDNQPHGTVFCFTLQEEEVSYHD